VKEIGAIEESNTSAKGKSLVYYILTITNLSVPENRDREINENVEIWRHGSLMVRLILSSAKMVTQV
jgi:hypothetical protein